jgi:(p)ppGpp synthase/HD superfamily hydrolase
MYQKALQIAYNAHKGQFRDDGITPFIVHPIRVSRAFEDDFKKTIGVLHDVVEDTKINLKNLEIQLYYYTDNDNFVFRIIKAIYALSRRKDEKYFDYINRLSKNEVAVEIKIADVIDNLTEMNRDQRSMIGASMIKRYNKTLDILINL